jgi:hypothetical protein
MKLNKRGRRLASSLPPTYEADCQEVEKARRDALAAGATIVRLMEYCPTDNRIYVHEVGGLNGWVRGLLPLGIIAYTPNGNEFDVALQTVNSAEDWVAKITRILRASASQVVSTAMLTVRQSKRSLDE